MCKLNLSNIIVKGKWYGNKTLVLKNPKNNKKQIFRKDKHILDILKNE